MPPEQAFVAFTREVASWWPVATHSVAGTDGLGLVLDEDGFVETLADGTSCRWGSVLAWEPPSRLIMTWHPGQAADPHTVVDVSFTADGGGTMVRLVHSGWESIPAAGQRRRLDGPGQLRRGLGDGPRRVRRRARRGGCRVTVLQLISHTPGPAWVDGVSFREQPGVEHHLATMRGWLEDGHLVMGGPFLDADGGGAAIVRFASVEEADAAAQDDRAVRDGLLVARTRPWLAGLSSVDVGHLSE